MPVCKRCAYMGPTASFRRSPKGGFICRDKTGCTHDLRTKRRGGTPGPRSLQELLRF